MRKINYNFLISIFEKNTNIISVWHFGSSLKNIKNAKDIDFAILFKDSPLFEELVNLRIEIQKILNFEDIDILVLNRADIISRFEAIYGLCIYSKNKNFTIEYISQTAREYEYEMSFLEYGLKMKL